MSLTSQQRQLLALQILDSAPTSLSSEKKERIEHVMLTHFQSTHQKVFRPSFLFSGSLTLAAVALVFLYVVIRPSYLLSHDPELSSLNQDIQLLTIEPESFE